MAENLVCIDRETPMLLPPDLRDWVADDDLAHFIIHVVGELPTGEARVNDRGTGSAQYPPSAMLALLLYCYSQGIYSSRKIERATYSHVGVRYIMANHHPDHDTIARFRQCNTEYIKRAFAMTIRIGQELGFTSLGTMAIDGTSIRANAGWKTSTTYERLEKLSVALCEERLQLAEQSDEREEAAAAKTPVVKAETIRKAIQHIKSNHAQQHENREKLRDEIEQSGIGTPPQKLAENVAPERRVNLVDPECSIMHMKEGYCAPGYNAQASVDTESALITAALIAESQIDIHQLLPVAEAAFKNTNGALKKVIADAGYDNNHQIDQLEKRHGIAALVGVKDPHRLGEAHPQNRTRKNTRAFKIRRLEQLATPAGKEAMRKRKSTVETVFGVIKHTMGFREFLTRGRENVCNEWTLISAAYNLKRLLSLKAS
jgi:transposase